MMSVVFRNVIQCGCGGIVLIGHWSELVDHFRENGRVYVVGDVSDMEVFCFSTNGQMKLLNKYCEVIGMDVTYRTNVDGR